MGYPSSPMIGERQREAAPRGPELPLEDERALIAAAREGSKEAWDRLLLGCEPCINAIAGAACFRLNAAERRFDYDDVRQHVLIGFCTAIRKYDPSSAGGARLATYAWYWVRHEIAALAYAESGLGRRSAELMRKVRAAADELLASGRRAGAEEVALFLGISRKEVEEALRLLALLPLGSREDASGAAGTAIPDPNQRGPSLEMERQTVRETVAAAMRRMKRDDLADFAYLRFYRGMDYGEIAEEMGCTVARLKQMWSRAKRRLRQDPGIRALIE
jgi:RNA polymerase sigma factor (sigma-70 family)